MKSASGLAFELVTSSDGSMEEVDRILKSL